MYTHSKHTYTHSKHMYMSYCNVDSKSQLAKDEWKPTEASGVREICDLKLLA